MTRWWDRLLLAASWVLLGLGSLVWWRVRLVPDYPEGDALVVLGVAAAVLVLATLWRMRARQIAPLPSAFGLAAVAPPAVLPAMFAGTIEAPDPAALLGLDAIGWNAYPLVWIGLIVATAALAPFCWELTKRVPDGSGRRSLRFGLAACLFASIGVAAASRTTLLRANSIGATEYWWAFVTVAVLAASAAAALEGMRFAAATRATAMATTLGYVGMGLTVSAATLALAQAWWPTLGIPAFAVAATAMVLGLVAIRPLEVEADVARRERDLVILALEADRGRFASAIHDGPLADLTLLTLQLDAAGDKENAELVRSVAGELRSLGNELRVPIVDDLGAGPAIEWLAQRVSERTDTPIETELQGCGDRPPAAVELAIYRIAQEAIINAAKHGRGPVIVRYDADPSAASLTVTDAGPGISAAAQEQAARAGHLGLMLMARRAEAIGARLEVSPVGGGGTRVNVEWGAA